MKKGRYILILLVILIDQVTKAAVRSNFQPGESKDVLGTVMSLTYIRNEGAAFSMFTGLSWLLTLVPLIAIAFGIWYMEKHKSEHWSLYLALALTIGGGVSNLIDRLIFGFVTDMFDFHFWPVFNVADIAICVGCGILAIYVIRYYGNSPDTTDE